MNRRGFLTGLGVALFAAPAVVRAASLMPVKGLIVPIPKWKLFLGGREYIVKALCWRDGAFMLDGVNGTFSPALGLRVGDTLRVAL